MLAVKLRPYGPSMTDAQPYPPRRYAWFVVFVLILASLIAFIDRQVVAIVVGPMQADLGVGDTEIGWLYGVFALVLSFLFAAICALLGCVHFVVFMLCGALNIFL